MEILQREKTNRHDPSVKVIIIFVRNKRKDEFQSIQFLFVNIIIKILLHSPRYCPFVDANGYQEKSRLRFSSLRDLPISKGVIFNNVWPSVNVQPRARFTVQWVCNCNSSAVTSAYDSHYKSTIVWTPSIFFFFTFAFISRRGGQLPVSFSPVSLTGSSSIPRTLISFPEITFIQGLIPYT